MFVYIRDVMFEGQERFASMTRVYYRNADAAVIMFDLTNRKTFENAAMWKSDLDSKCLLPNGDTIPCLLLANKVRTHVPNPLQQAPHCKS